MDTRLPGRIHSCSPEVGVGFAVPLRSFSYVLQWGLQPSQQGLPLRPVRTSFSHPTIRSRAAPPGLVRALAFTYTLAASPPTLRASLPRTGLAWPFPSLIRVLQPPYMGQLLCLNQRAVPAAPDGELRHQRVSSGFAAPIISRHLMIWLHKNLA